MAYVKVEIVNQVKPRFLFYSPPEKNGKLKQGEERHLLWYEDQTYSSTPITMLPLPEIGEYKVTMFCYEAKASFSIHGQFPQSFATHFTSAGNATFRHSICKFNADWGKDFYFRIDSTGESYSHEDILLIYELI